MKRWFWHCCLAGMIAAGCQAPELLARRQGVESYHDMGDSVECTLRGEPAQTAEDLADEHFPDLGQVVRTRFVSTEKLWGEEVVYWHVVIAKDERWKRMGSPGGEVASVVKDDRSALRSSGK